MRECLAKMCLRDNPFRITPERRTIVWAGREKLKQQLQRIVVRAMLVSPTNVVINWGGWGTGKTHAARYFTTASNIDAILTSLKQPVPAPVSIFARMPKPLKSGQALPGLYKQILLDLTFEKIRDAMQSIFFQVHKYHRDQGLPEGEARRKTGGVLREILESSELANVFIKFATPLESGQEKEIWNQMLGIKKGFPLPIDTYSGILATVSGIFRILTYHSEICPDRPYSEVLLWIDENENILDLSATDQATVLSFYRDITDTVPSDLTMFLETTMPGGEWTDIEGLFGDAVIERITDRVEFQEFIDEKLAIDYIVKLMNHSGYRPDNLRADCPDEFYPFDEKALMTIVKNTDPLSPRRLNENCSRILELACYDDVIKTSADRIKAEYVQEKI